MKKKQDVMGQNEINIIISNRFDVFWRNGPGMSTVSKGSHKSRPLNNNVLMKGDCETLNEGNQNECTEKDKFLDFNANVGCKGPILFVRSNKSFRKSTIKETSQQSNNITRNKSKTLLEEGGSLSNSIQDDHIRTCNKNFWLQNDEEDMGKMLKMGLSMEVSIGANGEDMIQRITKMEKRDVE